MEIIRCACPSDAPCPLGGIQPKRFAIFPKALISAVKRNEPRDERKALPLNVNLTPRQEESRDEELPETQCRCLLAAALVSALSLFGCSGSNGARTAALQAARPAGLETQVAGGRPQCRPVKLEPAAVQAEPPAARVRGQWQAPQFPRGGAAGSSGVAGSTDLGGSSGIAGVLALGQLGGGGSATAPGTGVTGGAGNAGGTIRTGGTTAVGAPRDPAVLRQAVARRSGWHQGDRWHDGSWWRDFHGRWHSPFAGATAAQATAPRC